jgi:CHAT domain-containing protein/tetratricopeptide (TPR) repeat protein
MLHAAQCRECGPKLNEAAGLISDETAPQEEKLLGTLRTSQAAWQKEMASKLSGTQKAVNGDSGERNWWRGLQSWQRSAFASAAIVLVGAIAWTVVSVSHRNNADELIAQAYTEHRTLEVRFPGAKYAPMATVRGRGASAFDRPAPLLKAEGIISEQLRIHPDDPAWLQANARADLLEGNYESAIQTLQRALEAQPDAPALLTDLASAYFEQAASADRSVDFGNAIDALGRVLAKSPNDPVALFNRAVISERSFLYTQAIDDWNRYLQVEPVGPWADEARSRLAALQKRLKTRGSSDMPLLEPPEFAVSVPNERAAGSVTPTFRAEEYLDIAIRRWLQDAYPARTASTSETKRQAAEQALSLLARILEDSHHDKWLTDFVTSEPSEPLAEAVRNLAESIEADNSGNPAIANGKAVRAQALFRQVRNSPGLIRAQIEELYSLHRLFRSNECLRLGLQIEKTLPHGRYSWIETQLRLEEFSCFTAQAKLDDASLALTAALRLSRDSGYDILFLRALGFAAALETYKGNLVTSSAWTQTGLSKYWSGYYPPLRAFQFYDNLAEQAQRSHRWHLAEAAELEAVQQIASTSNRSGEGMARFQLAICSSMSGNTKRAEEQISLAKSVFRGLPSGPDSSGFEADAELHMAQAEAIQHRTKQANSWLQEGKAHLRSDFDSFLTWLTYYGAKSEIARQDKDANALVKACGAVVAIGEWGLHRISTETDRLTWTQATAPCYRDLTAAMLAKDPYAALEIWEWYRSAGARSPRVFPGANSFAGHEQSVTLPDADLVSTHIRELDRWSIISYAELPGGISAWFYDNRGVHWAPINMDPETVRHAASEFRRQCADPTSDLNALRANGERLYKWLIAPFSKYLDPQRTLVIEVEGPLSKVPFQAFVEPSGAYLGVDRSLAFVPGLGYLVRLRPADRISTDTYTLAVGDPASFAGATPLPEARMEAEQISAMFKNHLLLSGKEATRNAILSHLPKAGLFHFAGHAVSGVNGVGLEVFSETADNLAKQDLISPREIEQRDLQGLRLAVLSACSTANGPESGVADPQSIAAAFLRKGVPDVIASRWNVDSNSAVSFMRLTYESLMSGRSPSDSLRATVRQLSNTSPRSHPFYWAAFSVFGR